MTAVVLAFPVPARTCWECSWFQEISDAKGVSSHCTMFGEPIYDENQGNDCEAYSD